MTQDVEAPGAQPLSADHRKYIAGETAVSVIVNSVLSLLFALFASSGVERMPLLGPRGMAIDFVPQCFMITFATTVAVTLLTRKRLRAGKVAVLLRSGAGVLPDAPANAMVRGVLFGLVVAVVVAPLSAIALYGLGLQSLPVASFIAMKVAFGALLALIISPPIIRAALTLPGK